MLCILFLFVYIIKNIYINIIYRLYPTISPQKTVLFRTLELRIWALSSYPLTRYKRHQQSKIGLSNDDIYTLSFIAQHILTRY